MQFAKIDDRFSAAGQLQPEDMAEAAAQGFKTVINNRPDGEGGPEQPSSEACRAAAEAAGLTYHYIPMTPQTMSMELLGDFHRALTDSPQPVLAHCKSGARSTALWALTETCHDEREVDAVIEQARQAGYDLSGMRPMLEAYAAQHRS
ncbi:MAG: TIGR01244 family sulfur transferase [Rhodovibrionaceae bacterium]